MFSAVSSSSWVWSAIKGMRSSLDVLMICCLAYFFATWPRRMHCAFPPLTNVHQSPGTKCCLYSQEKILSCCLSICVTDLQGKYNYCPKMAASACIPKVLLKSRRRRISLCILSAALCDYASEVPADLRVITVWHLSLIGLILIRTAWIIECQK